MILQYRLPGYRIVTAFIIARQGRSVRWDIQAHLRRAFQKRSGGAAATGGVEWNEKYRPCSK